MKSPSTPFIVVVEDHAILRDELVYHLTHSGFTAVGVNCALAFDDLLAVQTRAPDMVVLDVMLPGENGFSIAQRLRQARPKLGIVMLTGRGKTSDIVRGYEHGVDIYLPKPVDGDELVAAMNSLWSRLTRTAPVTWQLDVLSCTMISPTSRRVPLSTNERAMITHLAQAPDQTMESPQLMLLLADETVELDKSYLEVLLSRLRKKLSEVAPDPSAPVIKAVRGKGYQLCVRVESNPAS